MVVHRNAWLTNGALSDLVAHTLYQHLKDSCEEGLIWNSEERHKRGIPRVAVCLTWTQAVHVQGGSEEVTGTSNGITLNQRYRFENSTKQTDLYWQMEKWHKKEKTVKAILITFDHFQFDTELRKE